MTLPKMPPLCAYCVAAMLPACDQNGHCGHEATMRAYALQVVEECARVCEAMDDDYSHTADCAAAIRARFTSPVEER